MVKVMNLPIKAGSRFEMKIRCVKGMYMLKVASSEKKLGFKGVIA